LRPKEVIGKFGPVASKWKKRLHDSLISTASEMKATEGTQSAFGGGTLKTKPIRPEAGLGNTYLFRWRFPCAMLLAIVALVELKRVNGTERDPPGKGGPNIIDILSEGKVQLIDRGST
jgi:hypothetical protein